LFKFNENSRKTNKWCKLITLNKQKNILFVARHIGPHQQKILDQIIKEKLNLVILCSTKSDIKIKYQSYLHPYFSSIAKYTFANWALVLVAPLVIGVYTATFGWAASFAVNCKKVIFALGSDMLVDPYKNSLKKITIKVALRRCNLLLIDNIQGIENAYALGFSGKTIFSPFGVEIPNSSSKLDKRIKQHGETILWVRGTNSVYNIDCFLKALNKLREYKEIKWKVIFAGRGTSSTQFKSKIKEHGLEKYVQLKGLIKKKSDMIKLYSKASIFVSSSFSDGTSVALLEGMAYGLTIVVSDFKNNAVWIKNEGNGFLFNPKKPEELADIFYKILNGSISIDDRKVMNTKSRKLVKKNGSLKNFNDKVSEMLLENSTPK